MRGGSRAARRSKTVKSATGPSLGLAGIGPRPAGRPIPGTVPDGRHRGAGPRSHASAALAKRPLVLGTNQPSAARNPSPLSMRFPPPALGYVRSSGRASESRLEHKRPRGPRRLEAAGAAAAVGSGAPATAFSRRRRRPSSAWHSARPGRFVASRPSSPSHGLRFATPA